MRAWISANPMTAIIGVVFIIVAVVGGVVTIVDNGGSNGFTFEDYTDALTKFALAVGILGAGKAIKRGLGGGESPQADLPQGAVAGKPGVGPVAPGGEYPQL